MIQSSILIATLLLTIGAGSAPAWAQSSAEPATSGVPQAETDAPTDAQIDDEVEREPYRNPDTVALRSLLIPGWGQQVNGQTGKGWFLTSLAVFGVLLGTETIQLNLLTGGRTAHNLERDLGWFMYGGAVAWATIDGYLVAQRINRENGYDLAHWPGPPPSTGVRVALLRVGF